ncbi:MAG: hypothetical protein EPN97_05530 [Alphaproteobacteria bacterium]|nr:MAG: hypothetical protein EPN97_05530 [Alphaproteobacteria bacterium]
MQNHNDSESARPTRYKPARSARGLKSAWAKARRRLRALTVAAALTFGAAQAASAQTQQIKPAPSTAIAVTVTPHKSPGYAFSERRLNVIKAKIQKTALGREMLQFADDQGIRIEMSNSRVMDDAPGDGFMVKGAYSSSSILLNGEEKKDDELVLTLVHELRHAWHDLALRQGDLRLDPLHRLIRDRILEADVFAFEAHFGYEYEKATGARLGLGGDRMKPCKVSASSLCILDEYAVNRNFGMDVSAAYGRLIERTLKVVHAKAYDRDFLDSQNGDWQVVIDKPGKGADRFGAGENGLTPEADFAAAMRRATVPGMTVGKGISGLASWTEKDFSSLRKTGGGDAATLLRKSTKKFDRARAAWNAFQKRDPETSETPAAPPARVPINRDSVQAPKPGA